MYRCVYGVILFAAGGSISVQAEPEEAKTPSPPLQFLEGSTLELAQKLDWSHQHQAIESILENLWDQNEWISEADLAAKEAFCKISRIPPWQLTRRMQMFNEIVSQRYGLNAQQQSIFQEVIYSEMFHVIGKYARPLMPRIQEVLQTRVDGRPFNSEQVARWETQFDPYVDDLQQDMERLVARLRDSLTPGQREVFDRDAQSLHKRMRYYLEARERWKAGQWIPSEWGLQDDPVHMNMGRQAGPHWTEDARILEYDERTWHLYVAMFCDRYHLAESQRITCLAILKELVQQAQHHRRLHAPQLQRIAPGQLAHDPLTLPIRSLFSELRSRLAYIPTQRQIELSMEGAIQGTTIGK